MFLTKKSGHGCAHFCIWLWSGVCSVQFPAGVRQTVSPTVPHHALGCPRSLPAEREDLSSRLTQASSAMQAMAAEKAAMLAEIERLRMQVAQVRLVGRLGSCGAVATGQVVQGGLVGCSGVPGCAWQPASVLLQLATALTCLPLLRIGYRCPPDRPPPCLRRRQPPRRPCCRFPGRWGCRWACRQRCPAACHSWQRSSAPPMPWARGACRP